MRTNIRGIFIGLLLGIVQLTADANMRQLTHGPTYGSPFLSEYVEIEREHLHIILNETFNSAAYQVTYYVNAHRSGKQIPMLFIAEGHTGGFEVALNGQPISLIASSIVSEMLVSPNSGFDYITSDNEHGVSIKDNSGSGRYYDLSEMKAFYLDVDSGRHKITVKYTGGRWVDLSGFQKIYSFRYSLYPAKRWLSFNNLVLTIDTRKFKDNWTTNIGPPDKEVQPGVVIWERDSIPTNTLIIKDIPEMPLSGKVYLFFVQIKFGFLLILTIILIHFFILRNTIRKQPTKQYTFIRIVGVAAFMSLLLPSILAVQLYSAPLFFGERANGVYNYYFMIYFFYPIFVIAYTTAIYFTIAGLKLYYKGR